MTRRLAKYIISVASALDDIWASEEDTSIREAIERWALKRWQQDHPEEENAQYIGTARAKLTLIVRQDLGPTFECEIYDPSYE